ncbi:amino acid permease [Sulfobacillus thermosulfidooxidans]|uniref:amino acid permease n=1 Tax=Sulfobacillus thermosulfidooxidans TaxID=28034 RepID=UPI0006B3FE40|nr:amino acid permease [Sulfobacillus thermosulfidooxidans]
MTTLKRVLTWREGAGMTIAGVLGSGILILPTVTAQLAGPAAIVAWLLMTIMAIPMAATFGKLAIYHPNAGGIASYARLAFGPRAGKLVGILYLGTVPVAAPAAALIGAGYLGALCHWPEADVVLVAAGLLATALLVNYFGIQFSGWAATAVVVAISALLLMAVMSALPHMKALAFVPFLPHGWWPVGQSVALLYWAFVGWEMIGHLSEEFVDPVRDIPRALMVAVAVVGILYLAVSSVSIGTMAYRMHTHGAGLSVLIGMELGHPGAIIAAVIALLITYGTIHTYIAGFSRLVYAQARTGDLPRFFAHLHPKRRTPARVFAALLLPDVVILGSVLAFHTSLAQLIAWPSAVFIVLYIVAMVSAWRLLPGYRAQAFALLGALISCAALIFVGWAMILPIGLAFLGWWLKGSFAEKATTPEEIA